MPVASVLSGITDAVTAVVGDYGLYAVFLLMLIDAVLPAASELVMVYGGALAAGALAASVVLFAEEIGSGWPAYVAISLAGTVGYTLGSIGGWAIGIYGGRPFVERHGRWIHFDLEKLEKADHLFERYGDLFVVVGRVLPVVRSFVAVPAGIARMSLGRYTLLTIPGSAIWCFALAGVGWTLGANWERFHHAFRYADYAVAAVVLLVIAYFGVRWWLGRRERRAAESPSEG